jgi:ribosomal protein S18 acetylase RimI-like enzyme
MIRQANQSDAKTLASLVFTSAPVAIAAIFEINQDLSALNFLQNCLSYADGQYGYLNHWVAEVDNQVVGCFSPWHCDLADSFHQATLTKLTEFYGISHTISVLQASQALQDCIPKLKDYEWCIGHFAVLPQYRNLGVATALIEFARKQGLSFGKSTLCLDVESTNLQAVDFYLSKGFVQTSQSEISPKMLALGIERHLHLSQSTTRS